MHTLITRTTTRGKKIKKQTTTTTKETHRNRKTTFYARNISLTQTKLVKEKGQ